jgi:K+-transporting ATPase KdpF subunit
MTLHLILAGVTALCLLAYLVVALLRPEKF